MNNLKIAAEHLSVAMKGYPFQSPFIEYAFHKLTKALGEDGMDVNKTEVGVAPYIDSEDLIIDLSVGDTALAPVKVPIVNLISDYLLYNQEMFSSSISEANKKDALALAGLLRLCAKRIEESTY